MIKFETITKRLKEVDPTINLRWVDVRYLSEYIRKYPEVFPIYMRQNNYVTEFDVKTGNWKHRKGKVFKKVNLI